MTAFHWSAIWNQVRIHSRPPSQKLSKNLQSAIGTVPPDINSKESRADYQLLLPPQHRVSHLQDKRVEAQKMFSEILFYITHCTEAELVEYI